MPFARCPICDDILNIGDASEISQPVTCSTCLSNLKIASIEPLELEEARRVNRPQGGYYGGGSNHGTSRPANRQGATGSGSQARSSYPPAGRAPTPERRPYIPPAFPPNPDKQVDGKRAQKWERPKQDEEELEEIEEFEDKFIRNRSKGKRGK